MPAPRDEAPHELSLLQKQLILAQVQILELEDLRDELRAEVAQRTHVLAELQTVADRALDEAQKSRMTEEANQQTLNSVREEKSQLQLSSTTLQRQLGEIQATLNAAKAAAASQIVRIGVLDAELTKLKTSRSWRWTAPLRSLGRFFR